MMNEAQKWLTFAHDDVRMASLVYQALALAQEVFVRTKAYLARQAG